MPHDKIKVLELFSGIGGMHWALKKASQAIGFDFEVVRAIDICDHANEVYAYNFPNVDVRASNICGLTAEELNKLEINAIFMSPPCQPFSRQGHQKDTTDSRTQPLLHIMDKLLKNVNTLKYVLLENVKGFEVSQAHDILTSVLQSCGFKIQEYLLCPKQLGIPNSRLRYYLIASKLESFVPKDYQLISNDLDDIDKSLLKLFQKQSSNLNSYMDFEGVALNAHSLRVEDKLLEKHAEVLDIVNSQSSGSCCFTKAYGKYAKGTGSVIQQSGDLDQVFQSLGHAKDREERLQLLETLKLRYFSPKEVSNLLGFPQTFTFPSSMMKQDNTNPRLCFRLLGNSLNVTVVALLTAILFKDYSP